MSILADRNKDEKFIFYALMAHSLEGFRFDYRENIYGLTPTFVKIVVQFSTLLRL